MSFIAFLGMKSFKKVVIGSLSCFLASLSFANTFPTEKEVYTFSFSAEVIKAYRLITDMRIAEASKLLKDQYTKYPNKLSAVFIEDYVDFMVLMTSEDQVMYNKLQKNKSIRINEIEKGDPKSPYYRYMKAEIYLHWAAIEVKFGNNLSCLRNSYNAYQLLTQNQKLHPEFIPNLKCLGIMHALIGMVPDQYKSGLKWLSGMEGSLSQGLAELNMVMTYAQKHDFLFADETKIIYTFMLLHLNNEPEDAWKLISSQSYNPANRPMMAFLQANVAARTGKNDEAINILHKLPIAKQFYPLPQANLLLGHCKLNRLDLDANKYIVKFLTEFKGKNYIKEGNLLLAWHAHLQGNISQRNTYCANVKSIGSANTDDDKSAIKEAVKLNNTCIPLLKARLLFDGGYYNRALSELEKSDQSSCNLIEYSYRKARCYQKLKEDATAIALFTRLIDDYPKSTSHLIANSALQCAILHEMNKNPILSRKFYQICLNLNPDEYKDSLDAKAKAGLQRIKNQK